jgi:hypothetical protein
LPRWCKIVRIQMSHLHHEFDPKEQSFHRPHSTDKPCLWGTCFPKPRTLWIGAQDLCPGRKLIEPDGEWRWLAD